MNASRTLIGLAIWVATCTFSYAQTITIAQGDTTHTVATALKGKKVSIKLANGQELTGVLKDATEKLIVLTELAGKEFFDAVIPVSAVEAIVVRVR